MEVFERRIQELIPYTQNPRNNQGAVEAVAESIRQFGFRQPIVIDRNDVVVAGHTRLQAAKKLRMKAVPCVIADDLTDEQVAAYRLADNKTAELADWNFELLDEELASISAIDMSLFGFDAKSAQAEWFEKRERFDDSRQEGNDEYNEFLDKFEIAKTTDDCYTPDKVYDAVADWVVNEYGVNKMNFVRPFYPGGDYQRYSYQGDSIVVDNPPFSILSEILKWYTEHEIKFFLFAPALTLFSSSSSSCAIGAGAQIIYENGASVSTSFLTNLEMEYRFRSAPSLYKAVEVAVDEILREQRNEISKNDYPYEVVLSTMLNKYSKYGVDFRVKREESAHVRQLDSQKEFGKAIFGSGYLISEKAAAEKAAALVWTLSDRERDIIKQLG